jgi:hypothetical protein
MELIILIVAGMVIMAVVAAIMRAKKQKMLLEKYRDPEIVRRLKAHMFWQGQTKEQLVDSLGPPADIETKVYKESVRQTWKYYPINKEKFRLWVILENGVVVGWDEPGLTS